MAKTKGKGGDRSAFSFDTARENPLATAAAVGGAVAAGVFLWSRRNQISDQISNLSDQFSEWTQNMGSGSEMGGEFDDTAGLTTTSSSRSSSRRGMSETGGGNASLGRSSGGAGTTGTASGRGRAGSTPTT